MNLAGLNKIEHAYSVNEETGLATITFKDEGGTELGTIEIEASRLRGFIDALAFVAKERQNDLTPGLKRPRTSYSRPLRKAVTEF